MKYSLEAKERRYRCCESNEYRERMLCAEACPAMGCGGMAGILDMVFPLTIR